MRNDQIVSGANTIEMSAERESPENYKKSKNKSCKLKVDLASPEQHLVTMPE